MALASTPEPTSLDGLAISFFLAACHPGFALGASFSGEEGGVFSGVWVSCADNCSIFSRRKKVCVCVCVLLIF